MHVTPAAAVVFGCFAGSAFAHGGAPPEPGHLAWSPEFAILACLAVSAVAYGWVWLAGGVRRSEAVCFAGGILALYAALAGPLDRAADDLFSAHMVQHLVLMAIAAPLLVLGLPNRVLLFRLGPRRRSGGRRNRRLAVVLRLSTDVRVIGLLQPLLLWLWHLPSAVEYALADATVHALMHATFLAAALPFWAAVLRAGSPAGAGFGAAALLVFLLMLHMSLLGALLTLAPTALYPTYALRASTLGWTPLEDQQLAGLIMWVPGTLPYLVAGLFVAMRWLRRADVVSDARGERALLTEEERSWNR